jgi:hypothetical protein
LSVLTSLSSVTRSPSELSLDSSDSVLKVLSVTLNQARSLEVPYDSLWLDAFDSLDSVAVIQARDASQNSLGSFTSSSTVELLTLLDNFTDFVAGQLMANQSPVDSVNRMFRTRIQPLSSTFSTVFSSIPQLRAEIMSKTPCTSFSLTTSVSSNSPPQEDQGAEAVSFSLVSTLVKSSLVDISSFSSPSSSSSSYSFSSVDSTQLTSNMLRLKMLGSGSSSISRIVVVLPTLRSESYPAYESDEYVNTTCESNDFRETVHVCHGELGDVEITHRCDGTAGVIVSKCPGQSVQPSCSTGESSAYSCSVLNYTSIAVTCVCELQTESGVGGSRSLSVLSESGALEVSAVI